MFARSRLAETLFAVSLLGLMAEAPGESRVFTDHAGRKLPAEMVSHDGITAQLKTPDGKMLAVAITSLSVADQAYLKTWRPAADNVPPGQSAPLVPDTKVTLTFPDLPRTATGEEATCEVHIPKNYDATKPVPLLVWLSGGTGSARTSSASGVVDFDRFVVVALPYPESIPAVLHSVAEGRVDEVWDYQQPMLKKVTGLIPNIDPELRIVGGTSNGAHAIGSGLDQRWKGFTEFFTAFILHEGGTSPGNAYRGARGRTVLIAYGENTSVLPYQMGLIDRFKHARPQLTVVPIPGEGHALSAAGRRSIAEWIEQTFPAANSVSP